MADYQYQENFIISEQFYSRWLRSDPQSRRANASGFSDVGCVRTDSKHGLSAIRTIHVFGVQWKICRIWGTVSKTAPRGHAARIKWVLCVEIQRSKSLELPFRREERESAFVHSKSHLFFQRPWSFKEKESTRKQKIRIGNQSLALPSPVPRCAHSRLSSSPLVPMLLGARWRLSITRMKEAAHSFWILQAQLGNLFRDYPVSAITTH